MGTPKWGRLSRDRVLEVTHVLLGKEAVCADADNDLIQFGPAFNSVPTERLGSPRSRATPSRRLGSRVTTPKRTLIDGSQLRRRSPTLAPRTADIDRRSQHRMSRRLDLLRRRFRVHRKKRGRHVFPKEEVGVSEGQNVPPSPYNCCSEKIAGPLIVDAREDGLQGCQTRGTPVCKGIWSPEMRDEESFEMEGMDWQTTGERRSIAVIVEQDPESIADASFSGGDSDRALLGDSIGSQNTCSSSTFSSRVKSGQVPRVPLIAEDGIADGSKELRPDSAIVNLDWACFGEGDEKDHRDPTSCAREMCGPGPMVLLETTGASSESDFSLEQVSARPSLSTLDTEKYGGTLSNSARAIIKSHTNLRLKGACPSGSLLDSGVQNNIGKRNSGIMGTMPQITPPAPPPKVRDVTNDV